MFDVGFSEMLVIAVVALIVLGPERLPKAARLVGLWVRKARAQWYSVKAELEAELANEQLRKELQAPIDEVKASIGDATASVGEMMREQAPAPTVAEPKPDPESQ